MAILLHDRTQRGRLIWPQQTGLPNANFGPFFKDWVYNSGAGAIRASGPGGDFPTGDVWMPAGTYVMSLFDLSLINRPSNGAKPYNNWLRFREFDGPNTVHFDLRPESAATLKGQTQAQAYADLTDGGGLRATNTGNFRWIFDGGFQFDNGGIHLNTGQNRIVFHRCQRNYKISEWRRQYDFNASLGGVGYSGFNSVGVSLTDDSDTGGHFSLVWSDPKMKGNNVSHFNFTCGWRLEGGSQIYVIACDIGPVGDDAMFAGNGSVDVWMVGCFIHEHDNQHDSLGGSFLTMGTLVTNKMHNDAFQATGFNDRFGILDSTIQGHGIEWVTDNGSYGTGIVDRITHGVVGSPGGDIGVGNAGGNIPSTVQIGSGAPTTRVSGHGYRSFSIGTGVHGDGAASQNAYNISGAGANEHTGLIGYTNTFFHPTIGTTGVLVPNGVAVDSDGLISNLNATGLAQIKAASNAAHNVFLSAYGPNELLTVMADYGFSLD